MENVLGTVDQELVFESDDCRVLKQRWSEVMSDGTRHEKVKFKEVSK